MENILNNLREETEKYYFTKFVLCYLKKVKKTTLMDLRKLNFVNQNKFSKLINEMIFSEKIKKTKGRCNQVILSIK